jgi:hypothetical protein
MRRGAIGQDFYIALSSVLEENRGIIQRFWHEVDFHIFRFLFYDIITHLINIFILALFVMPQEKLHMSV